MERQRRRAERFVRRQVRLGIANVTDHANIVVAYEPIWAIGSGDAATVGQIEYMAASIREELGEVLGDEVAEKNPSNLWRKHQRGKHRIDCRELGGGWRFSRRFKFERNRVLVDDFQSCRVRERGVTAADDRIGVVAIIGATATGKSALGVELARRYKGEVVNADSRLFYRGMDIGTAKPTTDEMRGVPHHLIDFLEPADSYSLSDFLAAANATINDLHSRDKLPIIVGGSGQYIWGLLEGWIVPSIPPNPSLRRELEAELDAEGIAALQNRLRATGATGINRVEMLNPRRLIRAIERAVATGDATGGASRAKVPPYDALMIGLTAPREVLHERVDKRVDIMIAAGWIDEVEALRRSGVERDLPSMSAIGYREIYDHIDAKISIEDVREAIRIGNHRLIGAQNNWFKASDERINWFDISQDGFSAAVESLVGNWVRQRRVYGEVNDRIA